MEKMNAYANQAAGGLASPTRQPQINAALDNLEGNTVRLEHVIENIVSRLEVVCSPSAPSVGRSEVTDKTPQIPTALVAAAINTNCERLANATDRLANALARLEI